MITYGKMTMPVQGTDQTVWEDSDGRTIESRLADVLFSEQVLKMCSWFLIGGVFESLAAIQLLSKYHVPTELLFFCFLGQGLFGIGIYYLTQVSVPSKKLLVNPE